MGRPRGAARRRRLNDPAPDALRAREDRIHLRVLSKSPSPRSSARFCLASSARWLVAWQPFPFAPARSGAPATSPSCTGPAHLARSAGSDTRRSTYPWPSVAPEPRATSFGSSPPPASARRPRDLACTAIIACSCSHAPSGLGPASAASLPLSPSRTDPGRSPDDRDERDNHPHATGHPGGRNPTDSWGLLTPGDSKALIRHR